MHLKLHGLCPVAILMVLPISGLGQQLPTVCTWLGNKEAAVSLTFDDNSPLQLKYAIPEMNKRHLQGTFFIVARNGFGFEPDWTMLSAAIDSGHEIGGHALTHSGIASEVGPTIDSLKNHMPWRTWFTWAYPAGDEQAIETVKAFTIAARGWSEGGVEDSTPVDLYQVKTQGRLCTEVDVKDALKKKGWLVETTHCISSDAAPTECSLGVSFLLSGFQAHLATLVAYRRQVWVGRFGDIVRYIRERNCVKFANASSDASTYALNITDTLVDSVYDYPLTLKVKLPIGWTGCTITQGADPIAVSLKGDTALFDAVPDKGLITVRKSTIPNSSFDVSLWPASSPEGGTSPTLRVWLAPIDKANGAGVVVCPGGGYQGLVDNQEGNDPAKWLNTLGVAGIVLLYRTAHHPIPMEDGQRAIQVVRAHASEWGLDTNRIGMMGFSAGGHVASTVGTHFNDCLARAGDVIDQLSCRPSFMLLLYPVISFYLGWGPPDNLVGNPPDTGIMQYLANDRHITAQTPPTFLAHAADDNLVPSVNSKAFYDSCIAHGAESSELHIYPHGGHGFYPYDSTISLWAKDGDAWMQKIGVYAASSTKKTLPAGNGQVRGFLLEQNWPNPFSSRTTIGFFLPYPADVTLKIYNSKGVLVTTLHDGQLPASRHQVIWKANEIGSGVYVCRMQAGASRQERFLFLRKNNR